MKAVEYLPFCKESLRKIGATAGQVLIALLLIASCGRKATRELIVRRFLWSSSKQRLSTVGRVVPREVNHFNEKIGLVGSMNCYMRNRMHPTPSALKASITKLLWWKDHLAFKLLGFCRPSALDSFLVRQQLWGHQTAAGTQALPCSQALQGMCFNLPPSHRDFRNVSANNKRSHSQSKKPSHQCFSWLKLLVGASARECRRHPAKSRHLFRS